ncbi:hypothetical protein [Cronobacter malonaticus]|uniref:hypothetical protein n=1 Tax=Cronobacter malonaticus TaxID=413503 RepID=UPI000CFC75E4|nr:hypothetical protein [Cronobacter malonaticus]
MTDTAKLEAVPRHSVDGYGRQDICYNDPEGEFVFYSDYEALKDALEAAEKRNAELERERAALRPVGVMSEAAFHRLEASECRFIALWPRPGIYLPRSRPKDGVVVYARTGLAGINLETGGEA